jgi:hypothetical protein
MEDISSLRRAEASLSPTRKAWAEPAILLERPLEAEAEGVPPGDRRGARTRSNGILGPLTSSPSNNTCKF